MQPVNYFTVFVSVTACDKFFLERSNRKEVLFCTRNAHITVTLDLVRTLMFTIFCFAFPLDSLV